MAENKLMTPDGEILNQEALDKVVAGSPELLLRDETLGTDVMYTSYKLKRKYEENEKGDNVATDIVEGRNVTIVSEKFTNGINVLVPVEVPTEHLKFKQQIKFKNLKSKPYVKNNGGFHTVEYRIMADGIIGLDNILGAAPKTNPAQGQAGKENKQENK